MVRVERSLRKAGFTDEITQGAIKCTTNEVEIAVNDTCGDVDYDQTNALADRVGKKLGWGGFRCAWGGWILQKDYTPIRQFNTR